MTRQIEHIRGHTYHGRKGEISNAFRYSVDYLLVDGDGDGDGDTDGPSLFSRNKGNLTSLHDTDHGGAPGEGRGTAWVREVLEAHQIHLTGRILLLAQPRVFGHVFNPVSFWLVHDSDNRMCAVIAEVTNTFGDRHSYLCAKPDLSEITPTDKLRATKIFHVSPFQPIAGGYVFRFDINADRIGIWIDYSGGKGGLIATLTGPRAPMTNRSIMASALRRPFGSRRVLALIHWQALRLWLKGALYRQRPEPPMQEVSQ